MEVVEESDDNRGSNLWRKTGGLQWLLREITHQQASQPLLHSAEMTPTSFGDHFALNLRWLANGEFAFLFYFVII